jgi:hypothetical protein
VLLACSETAAFATAADDSGAADDSIEKELTLVRLSSFAKPLAEEEEEEEEKGPAASSSLPPNVMISSPHFRAASRFSVSAAAMFSPPLASSGGSGAGAAHTDELRSKSSRLSPNPGEARLPCAPPFSSSSTLSFSLGLSASVSRDAPTGVQPARGPGAEISK